MYTLDQVRQIIDEWYPDLEVDAEIVRNGKTAELVVTSTSAGTQVLIRSEYDLYRWFGFIAPPAPKAVPTLVHARDAGQGWLF